MRHHYLLALVTSIGFAGTAFAAPEAPTIGVVNFANCVTESKFGKQEQNSFESLKKQMSSLLEETEKQMNEIATKFNDPEYLDTLSPEAEEELKVKFRTLNEELARYQNQYYQVLNQANMKLIQTMSTTINGAAEKIAKEKKLGMVINKEAFFYFAPQLDITTLVIAEMDKNFEQESKKHASVQAPGAAPVANVAPAPVKAEAAPAPEKIEAKATPVKNEASAPAADAKAATAKNDAKVAPAKTEASAPAVDPKAATAKNDAKAAPAKTEAKTK